MEKREGGRKIIEDLLLLYFSISIRGNEEIKNKEVKKLKKVIYKWAEENAKLGMIEKIRSYVESVEEVELEKEVRKSTQQLKSSLSLSERREALRDLMEIAEADGIILREEKSFIQVISEEWSLKKIGKRMIENTKSIVEEEDIRWSLLHELAFIYIASFHSAENELSKKNIDYIVKKIHEWSKGNSISETRNVFRKALQVYADQPKKETIMESVKKLGVEIPKEQRLIALDDLNEIMKSEGRVTRKERNTIENLARSWNINVDMLVRKN